MVTEKKGLSKRERIMLFLLIIVGSLALTVMYVIIPLYDQWQDKQAEYSSLQLEKSRVDALIASESSIRDNRNSAIARHELESERYLNDSHASDVGRMLNQLTARYGLQWVDQTINDPKNFVIPSADNSGSGSDDGDKSVFLIVTATMTTTGDFNRLKSLLDAVEKIDYIRITTVSYVWNEQADAPLMDRISLGFEVTMLKDASRTYDFSQDEQTDDEQLTLDYS